MDKTKIYLLVQYTGSVSSFNNPIQRKIIGFTGSKQLAEYKAWKLNGSRKENFGTFTSVRMEEASFIEIPKDEDFNEYLQTRKDQIAKEMQSISENKEITTKKFTDSLEELKKELAELESVDL